LLGRRRHRPREGRPEPFMRGAVAVTRLVA
jgi:hypothetical protein